MEGGLHFTRWPSKIGVGSIRSPSIVRMPSPRGSVNRFGPAEPGLKNVENMTDGDAAACQFNYGLGRNSALFVIDTSEMSPDVWIESAMGIGNHSDQNGAPLVHGTTTVWDPIEACTCFQSNVNGSGNFFGKAASSAFNRSARAALIG